MSCIWRLDTGFELVTGFIGLLQLMTIGNYNSFTNSHTLQFAVACTKSSIFSRHFYATVSNSGDSHSSVRGQLSQQPQTQTGLSAYRITFVLSSWPSIWPGGGPHRKHRFQQFLYCMLIRFCGSIFTALLPGGGHISSSQYPGLQLSC
jgi:hypothetical protein